MRGGSIVVSRYNTYMNNYMKERWKRRRTKAIEQLGGKCAECNETEDLEFDHIDRGSKTLTIARMSGASEKRFQEELAKCQLLCPYHHLKKTNREVYGKQ